MKYPVYSEYKDSGVEWLGDVPGHWTIKPFWTMYKRLKRTGHGSEQLLSVYRDYGVIQKSSRDDNFNKPSEDLSSYQLVTPGDLAMNKMKAWQGSLGVSSHRGIVSPAYFVFQKKHNEYGQYLHYLLRSPRYITGYLAYSKGIRVNQWDLDPQYHSRMPVVIPSISEQTTIANFLDRETTKIDTLISKQQKLISLLQEKRQAVISHAVTKGINPDAKMKDSGIEWLGEVPGHWHIASMKLYVSVIDCKHITAPFTDSGVPLASIGEVKGLEVNLQTAKFTTEEYYQLLVEGGRKPAAGDIIYSRNATVGEAALVTESHPKFAMGQDVCLLRLMDDLIPNFLLYQLNSDSIENQLIVAMVGATFKRINVDDIRNFSISVPPKNEQAAILDFLTYKTSKIDTLITKAHTAITLLQERRTALISAAVTGKIDVRGY